MEVLLEILIELICEVVLPIFAEVLVDMGVHLLGRSRDGGKAGPVASAVGYTLLGAALGGLSLLLLPAGLIRSPAGRVAGLVLAPLGGGGVMAALGWVRRRGHRDTIRLETFVCGALFALAFALVRFLFASQAGP